MVSPERLRKFSIFRIFSSAQLKVIADIAREESFGEGTILFKEKDPARMLYILDEGNIEIYFKVEVEYYPELSKEFKFRDVIPGELFGISALIEPHIITATARVTQPSRIIVIEAAPLLEWCEKDPDLAYTLIRHVARAAIERLNSTRLLLAEAWAKKSP